MLWREPKLSRRELRSHNAQLSYCIACFKLISHSHDMPPAKSRTAPDDSRSEASSTREKHANVVGLPVNGKGRRVASGLGMNSSLRDSVNVGVVSTSATVGVAPQDATVGVDYMTLDPGKGTADNKVDAMVNA
jgi:hypothetical protein